MSSTKGPNLVYEGCNFFRQRLVLATLSGKSVRIINIRNKDENPGLREFEASFVRLIDKITNGSKIVVNETGTALFYQPGLLIGGKFEHECNVQRSIGYYLESIACLAPFCKKPVEATLTGITNDQVDPSVDAFKYGTLPVLKTFIGKDDGLGLKIVSRGSAPLGGGKVVFSCPLCKQIRAVQLTDPGIIKRVRGIAYTTKIAPDAANRLVTSAKGVLLGFLQDIYIQTDHCKGAQAGKSPGFGITLVAETTNGAFLTAECSSNPRGSDKGPSVAEDLGKQAAHLLLEEIYRGGHVDSSNQSLACLLMALGQQDVSKTLIGPLSPYTIQFLRHLRDFLKLMFKLDVQKDDDSEDLQSGTEKIIMTCLGVGYSNLSKAVN